MRDSNLCECGNDVGNLEHIILACSRFQKKEDIY